jgi:hypothetical protein
LVTQQEPSATPLVHVLPNVKAAPSKNSNATYVPIQPDFCVKHKAVFNSTSLMRNCKLELVPFITHLENSTYYSELPLFIVFHNESKDLIRDHTGFVFQGIAGVMFLYSDSLSLRKALLLDMQTKIPVHSVELVRVVAPELELDLNLELYHGSLFVSELEAAVTSDAAFDRFKAFNPVAHVTHPLNIWMVYFSLWYKSEVVTELVTSLAALFESHPGLYAHIEALAVTDASIGSPETIDIQLSALNQSAINVTLSPVQIRYFLEAALLEDTFGASWLRGKHVLEIGGGYGGMAVTMQSMYGVRNYSIVDLPAAGRLQARYVAAAAALKPATSSLSVTPVSSLSAEPVASDLLVSFFAISELRRDTVDRYVQQYVRHAKNGLLQLNAYEFEERHEGELVMVDGTHLYPMLELFRAVYRVHPHAVLLPPPSFHQYHRIMWREPQAPVLTEEEMLRWCDERAANRDTASVANVTAPAVDGTEKETVAAKASKPITYSVKKPAAAPEKQTEKAKGDKGADGSANTVKVNIKGSKK